jgi:hypothetical protein
VHLKQFKQVCHSGEVVGENCAHSTGPVPCRPFESHHTLLLEKEFDESKTISSSSFIEKQDCSLIALHYGNGDVRVTVDDEDTINGTLTGLSKLATPG